MSIRVSSTLTLIAIAIACATGDARADCDPFYLLSACNNQIHGAQNTIDLPPGTTQATAIAVTTHPGYQDLGAAFVTHGADLHVIDFNAETPLQTLDLAVVAGLGGQLFLEDVKAAYGVGVGDQTTQHTQYALYVVGYWADATGPHPYYFILDQQALLDPESTDPILIDDGSLCVGGSDCRGMAIGVDVRSASGDAADQRAAVMFLEIPSGTSTLREKLLWLNRDAAPGGPWTVSLDSWNDEGVNYNAQTYPNIGMGFNRATGQAHGLFATSQQVVNMDTGVRSCNLSGTPVDLSIWALDPEVYSSYAETSYQFVALQGATSSTLIGFPEGQCPDFGEPTSISLPVGHQPVATAMRQRAHRDFDVYVASQDGTVTWFNMLVDRDTGAITSTPPESKPFACPTDITMLPSNLCGCEHIDSLQKHCVDGCQIDEEGNLYCPGGTEPKPPPCLDPEDPTCIVDFGPK